MVCKNHQRFKNRRGQNKSSQKIKKSLCNSDSILLKRGHNLLNWSKRNEARFVLQK